jgi:hypothetical protein
VSNASLDVAASLDTLASQNFPKSYLKPSAALYETAPRWSVANATFLTLVSGTLQLAAIGLPAGLTVTSISWMSGGTALATGTHAWFALYDSSRNLLKQSTDDTSPAWAANTLKTYNLSAAFTTTYEGLYYIGVMVAATTPPNLNATVTHANVTGLVSILAGSSSTGLTGTAPNPAAAITAQAQIPYGYVS